MRLVIKMRKIELNIIVWIACFLFVIHYSHSGEYANIVKNNLSKLIEKKSAIQKQAASSETVMMPMRDGVRLSTSIYKPSSGAPWPAVLVRTPYGKETFSDLQVLNLAGYVFVVQDVRGRYGSEGEDHIFRADGWGELQDGYDSVEWIAAQPWCNGKIGTWGPSAQGILQGFAAAAVPPHLTCQVMAFTLSNVYRHAAYQNGVYRKSLIEGWLLGKGMDHILPEFLAQPFETEFWDTYNISSRHSVIDVPALYFGGFYDCFSQGTLDDFTGRQTNGAPRARGNQKLIMGPWVHINEFSQQQGQLTFPPNSVFVRELEKTIQWFNYWLKGEQNGIMDEAPVQYYVMGDVDDPNAPGNEWRNGDIWPPASKEIPFYLTSDNGLTFSPAEREHTIPLFMNPDEPVPTIGGMNLQLPAGPFDQRSLESRDDVLVFSTEPLSVPVEIIGRIKAILYAESNLTGNDITVRLTDVYPDGRSMLVCDGVARAGFRESYRESIPITRGEVYRYEVDLWSSAIVFNRGHRICILIANTNYPRFDLNSVYLKLGENGLPNQAETIIHASQEYPSHLLLPVTSGMTGVDEWKNF